MPTRARNGGPDGLLGNEGFGAGNLGLCHIQIGPGTIHFFFRGGEFFAEMLPAIEHRLGEHGLGLLRPKFGFLNRDIERD